MVGYRFSRPTLTGYKRLLGSTGWVSSITIADEVFEKAIKESWCWVSAFHGEDLVGIGRILSDGALYALICDMIVLPEHQHAGIATEIFKMLKAKCVESNINKVWLFSGTSGVLQEERL